MLNTKVTEKAKLDNKKGQWLPQWTGRNTNRQSTEGFLRQ